MYKQIISAFVAASFNLQLGLNIGYSAILIPQLEQYNSTIPVTKDESAWIASVYALTIPLGSLFIGSIMERFGRLNAIKLASLPSAIGWSAIAVAPNYPTVILGRIMGAISVGFGTNPAVVYISEISDPELRGSLNSIAPMLAAFGTLVVYATGAIMNWRLVAWLNTVLGVLPAILIQIFAKESPIWLIRKGKDDEAFKTLKYLYKNHPKCEAEDEYLHVVKFNRLKAEQEVKKAMVQQSSFAEFRKPTGYKPMVILVFLFLIQQCSGIYITMIYAVTFIRETGTTMNAYYASIFIGLIRFVMSLCTLWLLRKFNRRPLLMISSLGKQIVIVFLAG
jgi:MFS family permease